MGRFTSLVVFGFVVAVTGSAIVTQPAEAAPGPRLTAIAEAREPANGRPMLVLHGRGLAQYRKFTLRTLAAVDVAVLQTVSRTGTEILLRLPDPIAPGAYTLELRYGKNGVHGRTVQVTPFVSLATGGTIAGSLRVDGVDGVVFGGNFGVGTLAVSGAGTRFVWYPAKGALRAGQVDADQWDASKIGNHSLAVGSKTTASGFAAVATGENTNASGNYATALGRESAASGYGSTALGNATTASGDYSVAAGRDGVASGYASTAMGSGTKAKGDYSVAMGNLTEATGAAAFALGSNGTSADGNYSLASGFDSHATAESSVALGSACVAAGIASVAVGGQSSAEGFASVATGRETVSSGDSSVSAGFKTTASGYASVAAGRETLSSGNHATSTGYGTVAQSRSSLAIGEFNVAEGSPTARVATDPVLVVGSGTADDARSNALTLLRNGNLTIAGTLTENSDARLKTDVVPLCGVLARLAGIRGVAYRFIDEARGSPGPQIGLLAQEVREAFPELVHEASDGTLSVAYGKLSAVLLTAVKEQEAEIASLRDELARARAGIAERLDRLEKLAAAQSAK